LGPNLSARRMSIKSADIKIPKKERQNFSILDKVLISTFKKKRLPEIY